MPLLPLSFFFFNDTATTEIYTLSLHDALPICAALRRHGPVRHRPQGRRPAVPAPAGAGAGQRGAVRLCAGRVVRPGTAAIAGPAARDAVQGTAPGHVRR